MTSEQTDIRRFVSSDEPCTSGVTNQLYLASVGSQQKVSQDGLTLCDFEVQQLREMFPDCSEDVVKEASEKYATLESAIDFIIGNSVKAIYMYTGILTAAFRC